MKTLIANRFKISLLLLAFLISAPILRSQQVEVRSHVGIGYYQGDLSPLPIDLSFSKGHLFYGISGGLKLNNLMKIHLKFMKGTLSGTDEDAVSIWRRERNLSFESSLLEYGFIAEFYLNALIPSLDTYGIEFYYTTGINLFQFNPQAYYNGAWINLQPLGTEGQLLNTSGSNSKYSLNQISIPFGLGAKFHVSSRISLGVEIVPRMTFTDYLDDVSNNYVSYTELILTGNELTANLANRTGEYLKSDPVDLETGTGRGDPNDNDWYLYTGMYVNYTFGYVEKLKIIPVEEKHSPTKRNR